MKNATRLDHFETLNRRLQWQAQWILTFKKVSQPWGFRGTVCGSWKNDGRCGTFEDHLQR
jgi:hypothetical protein